MYVKRFRCDPTLKPGASVSIDRVDSSIRMEFVSDTSVPTVVSMTRDEAEAFIDELRQLIKLLSGL